MNDREKLFTRLLNKKFGFPDAKRLTYRKLKQIYDEGKSEHVVYLEVRIGRGETKTKENPYKDKSMRLLYQLLNMKKAA